MNPQDEANHAIDRQAADWLIRRDRGLTAAEQDEFFQWLAADPRHGEWFARHQRTWKEFNLLAQWRPEHSAEPNPDLLAKPRRARRWLVWTAPLALAASLALAFLGWSRTGLAPTPTTPAAVASTAGGMRVLEDGSTIELRDDSAIEVNFTAGERRVALVRGEAFFTVAKDAARPFIVHANGVDVRAVGTAFNVRLGTEHVEVLVTEGKVSVAPPPDVDPANANPLAITAVESEPLFVTVGQRAVVPLAARLAPQIASVDEAQIAQALAWQPRLLDFDSTPLAEVIAEFNQRNRTQLVLADSSLASIPIVASVRSDNVEGFVRLLEVGGSVRVERRAGAIVLHAAQ